MSTPTLIVRSTPHYEELPGFPPPDACRQVWQRFAEPFPEMHWRWLLNEIYTTDDLRRKLCEFLRSGAMPDAERQTRLSELCIASASNKWIYARDTRADDDVWMLTADRIAEAGHAKATWRAQILKEMVSERRDVEQLGLLAVPYTGVGNPNDRDDHILSYDCETFFDVGREAIIAVTTKSRPPGEFSWKRDTADGVWASYGSFATRIHRIVPVDGLSQSRRDFVEKLFMTQTLRPLGFNIDFRGKSVYAIIPTFLQNVFSDTKFQKLDGKISLLLHAPCKEFRLSPFYAVLESVLEQLGARFSLHARFVKAVADSKPSTPEERRAAQELVKSGGNFAVIAVGHKVCQDLGIKDASYGRKADQYDLPVYYTTCPWMALRKVNNRAVTTFVYCCLATTLVAAALEVTPDLASEQFHRRVRSMQRLLIAVSTTKGAETFPVSLARQFDAGTQRMLEDMAKYRAATSRRSPKTPSSPRD
ncbi:hypothetical protein FB45DRAFT_1054179 [Roridomyces roridus]|uniref:Uncharacterized protein n=1 Tax=Roridomyces roridus TaxID=1738132 RepID=A0AAD7FTD2_9AGAR|nr:hypothetical protein FB45DRAFT_1054179 [Roridomyces roridus]